MSKGMKTKPNKTILYKLFKALYGLKKLPKLWYKKLSAFLLEKLGLKHTHANYSIFISKTGLNEPVVSIFIDNIKIIRPKKSNFIEKVKAKLAASFLMVDIGFISFDSGLKIIQDQW